MAITIDFKKEYGHLICHNIPKLQPPSHRHQTQIPERFRKKFVHTENSFVRLFCEKYDDKQA